MLHRCLDDLRVLAATFNQQIHCKYQPANSVYPDTYLSGGFAYSGTGRLINKVTLRRSRIVLRWVTVRGYAVFIYNQRFRPTQPPTLSGIVNEYRPRAVTLLGGWEGNRRSGVALAMRRRVCGISISAT